LAPYSSAYAQGRTASRGQLHVNATHCSQCHWPFSSFSDNCAYDRVKPGTGLAQPGRDNAQLVLPTRGRWTKSGASQARVQQRLLICYGCGGPHPWSEYQQGSYVIICPNQNNPGIKENATRALEGMRKNKSRRYQHNKKRMNLHTVNFGDLPETTRAWMQGQVHQYEASSGTSVVLSVTGPSTLSTLTPPAREPGGGNSIMFMIDVPCLAAGSLFKRMMPITIQSNLPHIVLQFGPDLDMADCPQVHCAVDTCTALTTGNSYFFAAVAKCYLHCLAKLLMPEDYTPIVLSGIVQANDTRVTTELEVGFQFHLPYCTSGGDSLSLLIATDPNVLVNMIIELPFIKATGMILDFVDTVAECKHLDCPPFPMDFWRTSNHVPVAEAPAHHLGPYKTSVLKELHNLEHWYNAKVMTASSSVQKFGCELWPQVTETGVYPQLGQHHHSKVTQQHP
jgi:hypothetical protein